MSRGMKVTDIIQQIEKIFGRQPEKYMLRLVNDALLDMSDKKQHYRLSKERNLVGYDRWYDLDDSIIDIIRVEILDTNDRYVKIPKLADPHNILRGDTDKEIDSLK